MYQLRETGSPEATDELYSLDSRSFFFCFFCFPITLHTNCVINGVKWLTYARDYRWKTQNSGVSRVGMEENTFYGHLDEILEFSYIFRNQVLLFRCKWFDTDPKKKRLLTYKNITSIFIKSEWYKNDPFILTSQAK